MIREVMTRDRIGTMFVYFYESYVDRDREGKSTTEFDILTDITQCLLNAIDLVAGIESMTVNFSELIKEYVSDYSIYKEGVEKLINEIESELDWYFKIEEQFL